MGNKSLKYLFLFILCVLLQVLIFNRIVLFHIAVPIIFIYFIIRLPINLKLSYVFTLAFLLGLIVDIFSDTPGVNALACTLIAALRLPIYYAYMNKDDTTNRLTPGVTTMGIMAYSKYLLTFIVIYSVFAFTIEYFSFADVKGIVIMSAASSVFTFIILLAVDCLIPVKS
ncbi:MAG: rod shape-determining protein MreD [Muribaculaceae bacterium]|nr:rod shape-determining protein MreD [Muribaculaceae bacterium]